MYFFLPDRFSDGNEQGYKNLQGNTVTSGTTPLFTQADRGNAIGSGNEKEEWLRAGGKFVGGKIRGVISKLGYLKSMGITAIWIGPIFKQIASQDTYHGYAIQNFLEVDSRFGTREDLKELVKCAHDAGIYVLLDVILNHCGDVLAYEEQNAYYTGKTYKSPGFWAAERRLDNLIPLGPVNERAYPNAFPDGAVWPSELQNANSFIRKGYIRNWDALPEAVEGDFFGLKKLNLGLPAPSDLNRFVPSPALDTLCKVFQYWLAYADIDGFRIDTVRHMGEGPTRHFVSEIRQFSQRLGKKNFLLVGEISDHTAREVVLATGLNAALSIGALQRALNCVPRGHAPAQDYFSAFANVQNDAERWGRNQIVTMMDDHDQIWKIENKARFCAYPDGDVFIRAALGFNLCTMGIPCIYYGTEQSFAGNSDGITHSSEHYNDQFIRETMFGGGFGAFYSHNRHFFDDSSPLYRFVREVTFLRAKEVALRRGDQYLCAISPVCFLHGLHGLPNIASHYRFRSVIAWLRVHGNDEVLCAINTSNDGPARAWVTLNEDGPSTHGKDVMQRLYPTGDVQSIRVFHGNHGKRKVFLNVPPAGFVIFKLVRAARAVGNMSENAFETNKVTYTQPN
jgi:glycosidase